MRLPLACCTRRSGTTARAMHTPAAPSAPFHSNYALKSVYSIKYMPWQQAVRKWQPHPTATQEPDSSGANECHAHTKHTSMTCCCYWTTLHTVRLGRAQVLINRRRMRAGGRVARARPESLKSTAVLKVPRILCASVHKSESAVMFKNSLRTNNIAPIGTLAVVVPGVPPQGP